MKRNQSLWNSVSVLVVAVLVTTCFTRGIFQSFMYFAVFGAWGVYAVNNFLYPAIERYKYRREGRLIQQQYQSFGNVSTNEDINLMLNHTLMCHVNHRITGYIKNHYPDATWKWETEEPSNIIAKGGIGRIQLFNVEEYNFADVRFDAEANISFTMLKAVDFDAKHSYVSDNRKSDDVQPDVDPQVWFEKNGRVVLKNLIADLASRGHDSMLIQDDGSCIIMQGDKSLKVSQLDAFPEKVYYPRLIKVMAGAGIAAKSIDSGLSISW